MGTSPGKGQTSQVAAGHYMTKVSDLFAMIRVNGKTLLTASALVAASGLTAIYIPAHWILSTYIVTEMNWYAFVCWEKRRFAPPSKTPSMSRGERQRVWQNCLSNVPDVSVFMRGWFDKAPLESITLQDCKRWLAWGFWGRHLEDLEPMDVDQVLDMVADLERDHNLTFREQEPGEPNVRLLAFDREPFQSMHYPAFVYAITHGVIGSATSWMLRARGFEQQRVDGVLYWVRCGDCVGKTPIVFAHGIGCGLLPYKTIIDGFIETGAPVILVDMPWISLKVCSEVPGRQQIVRSLRGVLHANGHDRAAFVGHSFGTFICGWALRHAQDLVASVALLDPVVLLLNDSKCLYSFVYRAQNPSFIESLLRNDTYINHCLRRRFWWYESILFVQDIQVPSLIVLSGKDKSVPVPAIHYHLEKEVVGNKACKYPPRVLDIEGQGHGEFLSCSQTTQQILDAIRTLWGRSLSHEQVKKSLSRADTAEMALDAQACE